MPQVQMRGPKKAAKKESEGKTKQILLMSHISNTLYVSLLYLYEFNKQCPLKLWEGDFIQTSKERSHTVLGADNKALSKTDNYSHFMKLT